jgi:methionyl-tRNA formyltransferase
MDSTIKKPKVIFFGTPDFAVPALKDLIEAGYPIQAVYTAPDKPIGRKQILTPSPIKALALEHGLNVIQPPTLKTEEAFDFFKKLEPELCIIVAYNKIIPQKYISIPQYGFINIHPSLLPKYRGPSPIQTAILNGEKETGVSIMLIDEEVDHGPLLHQSFAIPIENKYYTETSKELSELGAKFLIRILPEYISGELKPQEQDQTQATFSKKFSLEDGKIDWNRSAQEIYNQIRALSEEPIAWTTWKDKKLKIMTASPLTDTRPGDTIGLVLNLNDLVSVVTSKGNLFLETVQLEGSKPMTIKDFLNGHPDFIDSILS